MCGTSVDTVLCSNVPNLRSRGPVLQGSFFFFATPVGLTNRVLVRDSWAGAPLAAKSRFYLAVISTSLTTSLYPLICAKQGSIPRHSWHAHSLSSRVLPSIPLNVCAFPLRFQHDISLASWHVRACSAAISPRILKILITVYSISQNWWMCYDL